MRVNAEVDSEDSDYDSKDEGHEGLEGHKGDVEEKKEEECRAWGERSYPISSDNCDIMAVLFCSLRNLKKIRFHAHSDELDKLID